jgi:lipoyl(octanoyl) transferase
MEYAAAYRAQCDHLEEVLAARAAGVPEVGRLLLVEHDPVITVTGRAGAAGHLLASPEALAAAGVAVSQTDRGGDITYHGPGQLVAYPILDLNLLNLGLHDYMRLLEAVAIDTLGAFGVAGERDSGATGVWVRPADGEAGGTSGGTAKICAMGVRVRRWVSMHGLALNVTTDLSHFDLIVPCGLAGRRVTSLERELAAQGGVCPSMELVAGALVEAFEAAVARAMAAAVVKRASATPSATAGPRSR